MEYKCSVQNCNNIVPKNGLICPVCFSKYLDEHYYIVTCTNCKGIVELKNSKEDIPEDKRVVFTKCRYCIIKDNMHRFLDDDEAEENESF